MRFLFVDRILQLSPGQMARGIKHVTREDAYLCADETGRLCFIPSLIGETLGQLAAWSVMAANDFTLRPVAGVVASARMHRSAYVGETLMLESVIDALDEQAVLYHSIARIDEEIVFTLEGALGPLLPMNDFIDREIILRQFTEINRPGDWPQKNSTHIKLSSDRIQPLPVNTPVMRFDCLLENEPGIRLIAEKKVTAAAPYFPDHFPKKPVLPLTILLEAKCNLAYEFLAQACFNKKYKPIELRKIKMNEFVHPGDVLKCHMKLKHHDEEQLVLSYRTEVEGKRVCVLELVMTAESN